MASEPAVSEKVVRLTLNKEGFAVPDQDPIELKKGSQKVRWCADFDFTIDVEGYRDLKYAKSSEKSDPFRCVTGTFPEVRRYKYSITANGKTNDPDLDIKP
jgi:hypothetical protein